MPIVTDTGFTDNAPRFDFVPFDGTSAPAITIGTDTDLATITPHLGAITAIEITIPSFADGRGFSQARVLRDHGFTGHLRATGPLIADQYAMARRAGFDDVQIPDDLAARQPEAQWLARADWQAHDYQSHLRG